MNNPEQEKAFLSIVAPVFNEAEGIEKVVRYWAGVIARDKISAEIVLTNDGSTDGTLAILSGLKQEFPFLKVVSYAPNKGYGKALSCAINASSGEYVLTIDSDGQFDAAEYKILLDKLEKDGLDLVTGFRRGKKDSIFKVFCDRSLNFIIRTMFSLKLKDTNCALKLAKGTYLRSMIIESSGYPTPTEIVIKASVKGAKVGEAGITHLERKSGISKLKPIRTALNMLAFLVYLRYKVFLYRRKIITEV